MLILNNAQTKKLEDTAVEQGGIEHIKLMENAGTAAFRFINERLSVNNKSVAVVCGRGNNGGDGFALARKMLDGGAKVRIMLALGQPTTEDAYRLLAESERAGIKTISYVENDGDRQDFAKTIEAADIIVDAIFGVGFHGTVSEGLKNVIDMINNARGTVVSIDVPSGVDSDSGEVAGPCVRADYTVTFTTMKPGHVIYPAVDYCGHVHVALIGIDERMVQEQEHHIATIDYQRVRSSFPLRSNNTHKGVFGRLLCICGSVGMAGSATFAGKAAVMSGVGMVEMAVPRDIYPIVAGNLVDPIYVLLGSTPAGTISADSLPLILEKMKSATAVMIGSGMGRGDDVRTVVEEVIRRCEVPLIIDADGLNAIKDDLGVLSEAKAPIVMTPHPGEMARLVGKTNDEVQSQRLEVASSFAMTFGVYLVLKGANTVCATPDGRVMINLTGNPGMSKAGSGDVLSGLIGSLLAQGMAPEVAAAAAVHIHGMAGDKAAESFSQHSMTPNDIIMEFSDIFADIEKI
ncbi:MAG: NAD(P)H-hydrate dehydratase [Clostridia bacterium]|nr:NAD(P)H-hydrate dehydratase [Clostridia bacterium]MBQ1555414.1 NAD(P)H-hydrate dehydratase [Clostridia bacterium]MBQ4397103.1 NAD(P)H-hydrate dehydratase [Clostridia bacterium]